MTDDGILRMQPVWGQTAKLGRKVEHDPRSKNFPLARRAVPIKTVLHKFYAPILDQGDLGACTGFSMTQLLNTAKYESGRKRARLSRAYLRATDARALYARATIVDSWPGTWPPEDTGSSGLAVMKAAQEHGYISSYRWAFGIEDMLQALMSTPVLVGTWWYNDMFNPDPDTGRVYTTGDQVGGHEYLCIGWNHSSGMFTFINSWGPSWGKNGRFRMNYHAFESLLADNGDVAVPVV